MAICRYCPFCKKAKAALEKDLGSNFTVVEVSLNKPERCGACPSTFVRDLRLDACVKPTRLAVCVQLDERQDGEAIQDYLNQLTGGRSVPRVFVAGKFIGGGDDTVAKQQSGELKQILQKAGAM